MMEELVSVIRFMCSKDRRKNDFNSSHSSCELVIANIYVVHLVYPNRTVKRQLNSRCRRRGIQVTLTLASCQKNLIAVIIQKTLTFILTLNMTSYEEKRGRR